MRMVLIASFSLCWAIEAVAQNTQVTNQKDVSNVTFDRDSLSENKRQSKFEYYLNGAVGAYFPTSSPEGSDYFGRTFTFQLQINYKDRYFTRLFIDSYDIGYKTTLLTQGITLAFNDRVQLFNLGGDFGYAWSVHRFSPYAYAGIGLALVNLPQVVSVNSTFVQVDKPTVQTLGVRAGAGFDFEISKTWIVFFESQFISIPDISLQQRQPLNGFSLQFGIKTPL
ncbi:MAG: outer membrane protein [Flammeovirgaceae bacterium]